MGAKKKPAVVTVVKPDDLPSRQPKRRTRSYKDHDGGQMEWNDVNEFKQSCGRFTQNPTAASFVTVCLESL